MKRITVFTTVAAGVSLIAAGIASRHDIQAASPATWILGIVCLWTIPLQVCIIPGFPSRARRPQVVISARRSGRIAVAGHAGTGWAPRLPREPAWTVERAKGRGHVVDNLLATRRH